jgi:HD-GYP domain-containing protein (c-di-GMP phosphodiesterase class II)
MMKDRRVFHIADSRTLLAISYSWAGYGLIFLYLEPIIGSIASALVLLPVLVSAWYGGMAYSMLAAMASFSFNMYMYILAGAVSPTPLVHLAGNMLAVIFAFAVGIFSETRKHLAKEITQRKNAELELRQLNRRLGQEIEQRSEDLQKTNQKLRRELDIRRGAQQEVSYREAILETVSNIAEMALKADSWVTILPGALQQLGEAANVDRVYIFENSVGSRGQVLTHQIEEWHAPGVEDHGGDPKLASFDFRAKGFGRWVETLSQGQVINSDVDQMPAPEREFLSGQGVDSILIVPVFTGFEWWGSIGFDSVGKLRIWSKAEIEALSAAASILGASILREADYERTLLGWAKALELRDEETEGHTQRVTEITVRLAEKLGCSEQEIIHIRRGALLHDIGKMGIPDSILRKPGPLNDEEWKIMRRHPVYARDMLAPVLFLAPAVTIPLSHHERWDGTGYPMGLHGKDIPFAARIFSVVDVWDALSSDRPYREAWETERVSAYIQSHKGKLFDSEIVDAFFELIETENELA